MAVAPVVLFLLGLLSGLSSAAHPTATPSSSTTAAAAPPLVCAGSRPPVMLPGESALAFCDMVHGVSCCDAAQDAVLRDQYDQAVANLQPKDEEPAKLIIKGSLCKMCMPSASVVPPTEDPAVPSTTTTEPVPAASSPPSASSSVQSPDDDATTPPPPQQHVMCLERISGDTYLGMAAHPDGSSRVFLWTNDGKVWLASVPETGSRRSLRVDAAAPVLDLTGGEDLALMAVALHPQFSANCRVFVSYTELNAAAAGNGPTPASQYQYQLVVAEFSAKGAFSKGPVRAEFRRIFTMRMQQRPHYGGVVLLFHNPPGGGGDGDVGHLYLFVSNGGQAAADDSSLQNRMPSLGQIVRFDVNQLVPADARHEAFVTGPIDLDPRGCSFDSGRPSHFFCAGVDEQQQEIVQLIRVAGEMYQGIRVVNHGPPPAGTPPSIFGGRVYRGSAASSWFGRLLYMFGSTAWMAMADVAPEDGGAAPLNDTTARSITCIKCSSSSPVPCAVVVGAGAGISLGEVHFVGEDNNKDLYLLAQNAVFRIVNPALCGGAGGPPSRRWPAWLAWLLSLGGSAGALVVYLLWSRIFAGGRGGQAPTASARNVSARCNCNLKFKCFNCKTVKIVGDNNAAQVSSAYTGGEDAKNPISHPPLETGGDYCV
ncbi:hypothetical protein ACP4OV_022802 [Aristida adscensionis]